MSKKNYSPVVNWNSPDGLPSNPPPVNEDGEICIPEEEYEPELNDEEE